jgi:hypothetical protein
MRSQDTVEAIRDFVRGKPSLEIAIEMMLSDCYDSWVIQVNKAIDHIVRQMAQNPEINSKRVEDDITVEVVNHLKVMGIDAGHDTKVGGHVDIKVTGPSDYHWLGEAKRHKSSYDWVHGGFNQLSSRYTTGLEGQTNGGLLIYIDQERSDRVMERWKQYLSEALPELTFEPCTIDSIAFYSVHPHQRTGRPLRVRHIPLSVYWAPI